MTYWTAVSTFCAPVYPVRNAKSLPSHHLYTIERPRRLSGMFPPRSHSAMPCPLLVPQWTVIHVHDKERSQGQRGQWKTDWHSTVSTRFTECVAHGREMVVEQLDQGVGGRLSGTVRSREDAPAQGPYRRQASHPQGVRSTRSSSGGE